MTEDDKWDMLRRGGVKFRALNRDLGIMTSRAMMEYQSWVVFVVPNKEPIAIDLHDVLVSMGIEQTPKYEWVQEP